MKTELKFLTVANAIFVYFVLWYTFDLLMLCIDDSYKDALTETDLNPPRDRITGKEISDNRPELIPKIIHQTYKTEDIPEQWKESQQKCLDLHPDYKYILWTDEMALNFIKEEYPWFLDTFEGYNYPIQRADAIRYFILSHYGGIYIDLDDGCERRLDPLLKVPAFVRKTSPLGVSNNVMGSVPRHPFYLQLLKSLKHYDKYWFIPYLTIMGSTGPLFVSVVWNQYKRWGVPENGEVRIMQPADYKKHANSYFSIEKGSSWHLDDAAFMKTLENHILSCVVVGFIIGFIILYGEYVFYRWLCSVWQSSNEGSDNDGTDEFMYNANCPYAQHNSSGIFFSTITPIKRFNRGLLSRLYSRSSDLISDPNYANCVSDYFKAHGHERESDSSPRKGKRTRKDSNAAYKSRIADIEKLDPNFEDLST
ncbi:Mannosyl phosphorylinositol ceramide synthase CSH1 [Nakaseomyces bracarensis]|uniref:Mannosyl phosphorylinositol ceramide synthase CSH1 n=1 Tax=Nakaseomyces bracarensis TaxID=273131 RepID=A0ABR4P1R2_9SACH